MRIVLDATLPDQTKGEVQILKRIVGVGPDRFDEEDLADVRFVPLLGAEDGGE